MKWSNQIGSSDAFNISDTLSENRLIFVITRDASEAYRVVNEIRLFSDNKEIRLLPDWETLPYDKFSPHFDLISERLETLYQITNGICNCVVSPITTLLYRLGPPSHLAKYSFILNSGATIKLDQLKNQMNNAGYQNVNQVISPGEFCIRGGVIDLFPMGSVLPYRIDLFDTSIEKIRTFDPDSQRGIYPVANIRLLPAREFPTDKKGVQTFRDNFRREISTDPTRSKIYKDISVGAFPPGIEYYLPLFFSETSVIADYLPSNTSVCILGDISSSIDQFWKDTNSRYKLLRGDIDFPLLSPNSLFMTEDEFFKSIKKFDRIQISNKESSSSAKLQALPDIKVEKKFKDPLKKLKSFVEANQYKTLIFSDSLGRRQTLHAFFSSNNLNFHTAKTWKEGLSSPEKLILIEGPLTTGFIENEKQLNVITEGELYPFHTRKNKKLKKSSSAEHMLKDLSEIRIGDPVVHIQHGIGTYQGLKTMNIGDGLNEYLELHYEDSDKLFLPVSQLEVISRYSGSALDSVNLDKLGGKKWDKAKKKAAKQIRDTAAELLHLYAERSSRIGYSFPINDLEYKTFCEEFEYEETIDQLAAIEATIKDLMSDKPMDRLICGDVGFGKTEVALRASFVAVNNGKQVAVLVPTTLLAEQHFQTFTNRFANWAIEISELSRFKTTKESSKILADISRGKIDIVIGTHKLISQNNQFKNLGLVIIDEEHRFGVRQKEKLKKLRSEVDVLTLTATPIPRTLAMSLEGLRDFSIISTAPAKRLAIKTFVSSYSTGLIKEATMRELKRGGQIYFLHNSVATINITKEKLSKLLPEANIQVAHGQMPERDLERIMKDFYRGRFNFLICTTIIETGIDIPAANTIIIDRADKFGLAQLHQLRGRVGRSHHQAYAYLLIPGEEGMKRKAKQRLDAIQLMEELGAGFYLAIQDMEIRGAGEVLGDAQSGEMHDIGFQLYCDMLNHAVRSLQNNKEPDMLEPFETTIEVNLHNPALLPKEYCENVHQRLILYKRLANCKDENSLSVLVEEITDRFGIPLPPVKHLILTHEIRIAANHLGIRKIDVGNEFTTIQFRPKTKVKLESILALMEKNKNITFSGSEKIKIKSEEKKLQAKIIELKLFFARLAG